MLVKFGVLNQLYCTLLVDSAERGHREVLSSMSIFRRIAHDYISIICNFQVLTWFTAKMISVLLAANRCCKLFGNRAYLCFPPYGFKIWGSRVGRLKWPSSLPPPFLGNSLLSVCGLLVH